MGKVWHPGMPNTPAGDDYPKSWNEKVQALLHVHEIADLNSLHQEWTDLPFKTFTQMFHTNSTDDPSFSWKAYTEEEMEETTLRCKEGIWKHCNHLHRDIANTDYTIEKLRELAPAALLGEQNFFVAYGLHKVARWPG